MRQAIIDVDAEFVYSSLSAAKIEISETRLTDEERRWLMVHSKSMKGTDCILQMKSKFNKVVSAATVSRYKKMTELNAEGPGRPQLLSPEEDSSLLSAVKRLRLDAHAVDASLVAAAARGLIATMFVTARGRATQQATQVLDEPKNEQA
jgi:hypothetical protein